MEGWNACLALLRVDGEALGAVEEVVWLRATVRELGGRRAREVGRAAALGSVGVVGHIVEIEEDGRQPVLGAVLDGCEHLRISGVRGGVEEVVVGRICARGADHVRARSVLGGAGRRRGDRVWPRVAHSARGDDI